MAACASWHGQQKDPVNPSTRLNGASELEACHMLLITRCLRGMIEFRCYNAQRSVTSRHRLKKKKHACPAYLPLQVRDRSTNQVKPAIILIEESNHTRLSDANIASTKDRSDITFVLATEPQELYSADRRGYHGICQNDSVKHVSSILQETYWE